MTTTRTGRRVYDRLTVEAAIARMAPDPDKLRDTIDAFATAPRYWRLVVDTLATAINTIELMHAVECDRAGCRTCRAISLAVTAVTAHRIICSRGGAR